MTRCLPTMCKAVSSTSTIKKKIEPQDKKGLLIFGNLLKSLEKLISCHPRKQADLNTYLCNSQNEGTTPGLPGWGMKIHAKSQERKQNYPTRDSYLHKFHKEGMSSPQGGRGPPPDFHLALLPCIKLMF